MIVTIAKRFFVRMRLDYGEIQTHVRKEEGENGQQLKHTFDRRCDKKAKRDLKPVQEAYDSLKNKETRYAVGILRVLKIRKINKELWEKG